MLCLEASQYTLHAVRSFVRRVGTMAALKVCLCIRCLVHAGSKASMLSAGSGYQADSDSNSDVPVEPHTAPASLSAPASPTRIDPSAGATHSKAADESSESDGQVGETGAAESEAKPSTPASLLGKIGNSVWGAVGALTGHPTESSEPAEDSKASAQPEDAEHLHSPSTAIQQAGAPEEEASSVPEPAAGKEADLPEVDSGYEAGEEGPVQAGPEVLSQPAPKGASHTEHRADGGSPHAVQPSTSSQQDTMGTDAVGTQPQHDADPLTDLTSESAAESGAGTLGMAGVQQGDSTGYSGFQEPLHVHTDPASSKRGISGVGNDQPGSASKRARGDSTVAKLINTFDSPKSGEGSPNCSAHVSQVCNGRGQMTALVMLVLLSTLKLEMCMSWRLCSLHLAATGCAYFGYKLANMNSTADQWVDELHSNQIRCSTPFVNTSLLLHCTQLRQVVPLMPTV